MSTGRMALIALVVLAILALVFLGFCRGPGTTEEPKATSTAGAAGTTAPKAGGTTTGATATAAPKTATGGGSGASNEFITALEGFKKAEFKVTYEMAGAGVPAGSTMTIAQSGTRSRFEFAAQGATMTMIQSPEKSYACMAETRSCFDLGAAGNFGGAFTNPAAGAIQGIGTGAAGASAKPTAGRTIAGVAAKCFEFSEPSQGSGVACLGPDGQLLAVESTSAQGTFKLTATKVEGKPAASDFEPPYPVTALPSGLGGFPGGLPTPPVRP